MGIETAAAGAALPRPHRPWRPPSRPGSSAEPGRRSGLL